LLSADIVAKVSNRGATIFPPEDKTGSDRGGGEGFVGQVASHAAGLDLQDWFRARQDNRFTAASFYRRASKK
jgi:hypothetical protein